MMTTGSLAQMAHADLDGVFREVTRRYRAGALETLAAADPGWRAALDEAEREVGELYEALCDADALVERWRQAVGELCRLWGRVGEAPPGREASLQEVA